MFRFTLLPLLAASVSLAAPVEKFSSESVTSGSGVNIHFTNPRPGEMEMIKAAGFKHLRMDFTWGSTEKEKGVYDFSAYDRLMTALDQNGMKGYFILDYSNKLYEPESAVRSDEGRAAYTKWALAALDHFKGRGICWEIWNEPNGGFWKPKANVDEYAALAVVASKAIHEKFPAEILVGPATSEIDLSFLEKCFQAGLLQYWDAVSVHPYRQGGPESVDGEYHALRTLISKYAPAGKAIPILSGEWGYSSTWAHHDPDSQGKMLTRQWLLNAANKVPLSIWYDWHEDGVDPKESEHHFGSVGFKYNEGRDPVYDPKPAYTAAKTFNGLLDGYRFVKRLSLGNGDHQAMLFTRDGKLVLAAWSGAPGESEVRLPSDDGAFPVINHLGDALPKADAKNGELVFKVNDSVKFFFFETMNRKLAAAPEALFMKVSIVPVSGNDLTVKLENFSNKAFKAKVTLDIASGLAAEETSQQASVAAEAGVTDIHFRLKNAPERLYQVGARIEVGQVTVAGLAPRLFSATDDSILTGARIVGEGDAKVSGSFTISAAAAPVKFPGGDGLVNRIDYEFGDGWKYAAVYPGKAADGVKISGRDGAEYSKIVFGLWIYGDASRLAPRLRIRDAGGRTWQPGAPEIKWTGWKYVECRLDENTAHWGGADDKDKRAPKFPLKWEAPFLLDNPSKAASKGSVYFTTPTVIFE